MRIIVGTSGYSFPDWVGPFYPPGTAAGEMFDYYVRHFEAVELNFTFYAMPAEKTFQKMADRSSTDFQFWVKANQAITHAGDLSACGEFVSALAPLAAPGKLAGIILQFPQSFHRSEANRKYLAGALDKLSAAPAGTLPPANLAVEFRHRSWDNPATIEGLRERGVSLVIPDVPTIFNLYDLRPTVTGRLGYLRLHSRDPNKWYAGEGMRYDYHYSEQELRSVLEQWRPFEGQVDKVYTFFNNCHAGHAAQNAESFRRILEQL